MGTHYINNEDFLAAIVQYKADVKEAEDSGSPKPRIPEYIGECLLKIATKLATSFRFNQYTYKDEMILDGVENCLLYFDNFDPEQVGVSIAEDLDVYELKDHTIVGPNMEPAIVIGGLLRDDTKNTAATLILKCEGLPDDPSRYKISIGDILRCHSTEVTVTAVRKSNPFGYYTKIVWYAFVRRINREKKQMLVKGKILQELPYDLYDLQGHDEDGHGAVESYLEIARNSAAFGDVVAKSETKKRGRKKKKETVDLEEVDEDMIEEVVHEIESE